MTSDIVVDADFMVLLNRPPDPAHAAFFRWLSDRAVLALSQKLLGEYMGSGSDLVARLIDRLVSSGRVNRISSDSLKDFKADRHYKYTCNGKDRWHARLVFLSDRKKLLTGDAKLASDVSQFRTIDGVKPQASSFPSPQFYL